MIQVIDSPGISTGDVIYDLDNDRYRLVVSNDDTSEHFVAMNKDGLSLTMSQSGNRWLIVGHIKVERSERDSSWYGSMIINGGKLHHAVAPFDLKEIQAVKTTWLNFFVSSFDACLDGDYQETSWFDGGAVDALDRESYSKLIDEVAYKLTVRYGRHNGERRACIEAISDIADESSCDNPYYIFQMMDNVPCTLSNDEFIEMIKRRESPRDVGKKHKEANLHKKIIEGHADERANQLTDEIFGIANELYREVKELYGEEYVGDWNAATRKFVATFGPVADVYCAGEISATIHTTFDGLTLIDDKEVSYQELVNWLRTRVDVYGANGVSVRISKDAVIA